MSELRTEYQYIYFVKIDDKPKTTVWKCSNSGSCKNLGEVRWYFPWRRYCFFMKEYPGCEFVFSAGCLEDIKAFLDQLMAQHVEKKEKGVNS